MADNIAHLFKMTPAGAAMTDRTRPRRIQMRRTKGWRMPANCVYVGRPTKWGNPFKVGGSLHTETGQLVITIDTPETACALFWQFLQVDLIKAARAELAGKDLACWCPLDRECHADAWLIVANISPPLRHVNPYGDLHMRRQTDKIH